MSWRLGVDIGGTFTDVVLAEEGGERIAVVKVSTTPRDFARGVLDALATALRATVSRRPTWASSPMPPPW